MMTEEATSVQIREFTPESDSSKVPIHRGETARPQLREDRAVKEMFIRT